MRDHPERLEEFGLRDKEDLKNFLDDIHQNYSETWTRPDKEKDTKAYVKGDTLFIDNPEGKPTVFKPDADTRKYLTDRGFTEDIKSK